MSIFTSMFSAQEPSIPEAYPNMLWSAQHEKYRIWGDYFTGEVLNEKIPAPDGTPKEKYPIKINICKPIAMIHSYTVTGEWSEDVFSWQSASGEANEKHIEYLNDIGLRSGINSLYIKQVLTHTVYGGMIWRITTDEGGIRWTSVPPEAFFPIYSTLDDELIECMIAVQIPAREAQIRWGMDVREDYVTYFEHWTTESCVIRVNNVIVEKRPTIDKIIPYVYIPRVNLSGERYGISVIEDLRGIQDELNARLADMGDAVVRESHKDMVVSGIPNGLKGIDRRGGIIDLGSGIGGIQPKVHDYKKAEIPAGTHDFITTLIDFSRYAGGTPPVAFGVDEGSQRSASTLAYRMWPLIQAGRSNRAFIVDGMRKLAAKTLSLAKAGGFISGEVTYYQPDLPAMMPKDRDQTVNEVVQLTGIEMMSTERALEMLDVPEIERDDELERINQMKQEAQKMQESMMTKQAELKQSTQNKEKKSENSGKQQ